MIILSNGDKWITGDKEWEEADIPYKEACKGNIPKVPVRRFVEDMCDSYHDDSKYLCPRKLTGFFGGYWDANFDWCAEVLGDVAIRSAKNDWSDVYVMPWGHVYVVFYRPDCGGYDVEEIVNRYNSVADYMKECSNGLRGQRT